MNRDIRRWTRSCPQCQECKVFRHTKAPSSSFTTPCRRFDHVHIDLVGPLPHSKGFTYVLTMVDRFTRWPEAVPLPDMTAETVASAFVSSWVARFGVPGTLTSDRGAQFTSALWKSLSSLLGTHHIKTTAYHPAANGIVERLHRQLKSSLSAYEFPERWVGFLPLVLLGLRSSVKSDLGCSSAELVYGVTLRLPGQLFSSSDLAPASLTDPQSYVETLSRAMRL